MDFKEFGEYLSLLRKQNNISQEQMAKDLRISRATISSFENGRASDVGFKKVLQIVEYLGFELNVKEKSPFPTFEELRDAR
ncbi:helix-turn-helix transcriptional regulator [Sulfurimonas sp.]|uniref:helix-turn-helix domain-containing protein n=1 Tax=Sulfurimonas sp. TaxID=2022749 RepID=UPI0035629146